MIDTHFMQKKEQLPKVKKHATIPTRYQIVKGGKPMFLLPNSVESALLRLEKAGCKAYIVGGCVRDLLLGKTPNDYDITTSAVPEEIKRIFKNEIIGETGKKYGTITVLIDHTIIEITTHRIDLSYLDHRRPDMVQFTLCLKKDLARRDFTINAIAYNKTKGLIDYWNGVADIKCRIIRSIGDASHRFQEDALRILRALRFASTLGFTLSRETNEAVHLYAPLLVYVSAERRTGELIALLCGINARNVLIQYITVLGIIIPELLFMEKALLDHIAKTVENIPPRPALRLAALLHHVGTAGRLTQVESEQKTEKCNFLSPYTCVEAAKHILTRLRVDNKTKITVIKLLRYQAIHIESTAPAVKRALNCLTPKGFFSLMELKQANHLAEDSSGMQAKQDLILKKLGKDILKSGQCFSLSALSVSGTDLIQIGMKPGEKIKTALHVLLNAVIDEKVPNEKEALLRFWQEWEQLHCPFEHESLS